MRIIYISFKICCCRPHLFNNSVLFVFSCDNAVIFSKPKPFKKGIFYVSYDQLFGILQSDLNPERAFLTVVNQQQKLPEV